MRALRGRQSSGALLIELGIASTIPAAVDLALSSMWGLSLAPYLILLPVITAFNGIRWGLGSFAFSVALGAAARFFALGVAPALPGLGSASLMLLSAAAALGIAFTRDRMTLFRGSVLERLRGAVHKAVEMRKQNEVLEKVNRVLEGRVSSQKDSITILHDQVKKLASLNLDQALETVLETVALFTEMSSGSIWRLDGAGTRLVPAATYGWAEGARRDVTLDPETSVEGYVFRNRKPFSVRMLLDNSEFDRFSDNRSIITMPIVIGSKSWGVIDIEDLPFERYSQYSETILAILLSLAEPYLRQITEYETLNSLSEVDPDTGYPLFSIFHRTISADLERISHEPGFVSLVILEISNFEELLASWSKERLKRMLFSLKDDIDRVKKMKSKAFHFKEDSQLVLIIYDLDHDGTSFFCLDLLSMFSEYQFAIDGTSMPVELIVGFSTSAQAVAGADGMITAAEYLLSVQRI